MRSVRDRVEVLLTGATGQVGGCVLGELVEAGARVTVLARPGQGRSAEQRVRDTLLRVGRDPRMPFEVVVGELTAERLGLDAGAWAALARRTDRVIHAAARVSFEADGAGEPWRTNVGGTLEMIRLAQAAGARLTHVSTAYVSGGGAAAEAISDARPALRNAYEESKWHAEQAVWKAGAEGLGVVIARPSIVVGAAADGRAVHFQGFYLVCRAVSLLCRLLRHDRAGPGALAIDDLDLPGDLTAPVDLVPADYVGAAVAQIGLRDAALGGVYHLTHPQPTTLGLIYEVLTRYYRLTLPRVDARRGRAVEAARSVSGLAGRFEAATRVVQPYFGLPLWFETARARALLEPLGIRPASVDRGLIERLIDYAEETGFGRRLPMAG